MTSQAVQARRRVVIAALVCATGLTPAVSARADGHEFPEAKLKVGARQQVGKFGGFTAFFGPTPPAQGAPPGVYCGGMVAEPAPPFYPSARQVPAGRLTGHIEIRRPDPPAELSVRGWTHFGPEGGARGRRSFAYTLRPKQEAGQIVAWVADVTFRIRKHLYLFVEAAWREDADPDGCPESVEGNWRFHLKTRRA